MHDLGPIFRGFTLTNYKIFLFKSKNRDRRQKSQLFDNTVHMMIQYNSSYLKSKLFYIFHQKGGLIKLQ